ncbi:MULTISPECIES: T9SS type A sorting domain-containing protein [unclassified Lentimicrobium]|uniref:T9SS type A sorting domain-containing protein n=1 Tax=unclassified Lentimicrobium TaxID=2677434 RepID=UPI0015581B9B|nr:MULTISPECIES: T9SS type A sorting domain-containing protein [unclassified Lentimicrobium]NPD45958.1 T9SS type A sorting domain-containing protein [Lentimicrobium sp. S6]NPD84275.1 T9SS type A sorting domain-containing protein [Lentimicrobium sp. L6]
MKKTLLFLMSLVLTISVQAQWMIQSPNFPDESTGVKHISIVNDDIVWISAYDGSASSEHRQNFSKTIDGGTTWTAGMIDVGSSTVDIAMITAIDVDKAWAVGYPNTSGQGGIFHTSDGGVTWARQESASYTAASSFSNVVWMDIDGNGFCQGDPIDGYYENYTTNDYGANWTRVPEANIPTPISGEYGYVGQIYSTANSIWYTTNKGRIFRSTDKGFNWEAFQSPISDFGSATSSGNIAFSDNNYGLLINNTGSVWNTENGGETWTELNTTGTIFMSGLDFVDGTLFAVATGAATDNSGSAWTQDGGITWNVNDGDVDQHTFIALNENHQGWSGGFTGADGSGGIYKYNGTYVKVEEMDAKQNITCFPNPTNNLLQVQSQEQIKEVRILNFVGQIVNRIQGTDAYMTIEMAGLKNGVYFVEVETLNAQHSVKVVKQ